MRRSRVERGRRRSIAAVGGVVFVVGRLVRREMHATGAWRQHAPKQE